jgi:hypothetical protein
VVWLGEGLVAHVREELVGLISEFEAVDEFLG